MNMDLFIILRCLKNTVILATLAITVRKLKFLRKVGTVQICTVLNIRNVCFLSVLVTRAVEFLIADSSLFDVGGCFSGNI